MSHSSLMQRFARSKPHIEAGEGRDEVPAILGIVLAASVLTVGFIAVCLTTGYTVDGKGTVNGKPVASGKPPSVTAIAVPMPRPTLISAPAN